MILCVLSVIKLQLGIFNMTNIDENELATMMNHYLQGEPSDKRADLIEEGLSCIAQAAQLLDSVSESRASEALTVIIEKVAKQNV